MCYCWHCRAQRERLASLEQEQRQVGDKLERVKAMVERAKSEQRNAQANLNKLQRNELSLKQVNNVDKVQFVPEHVTCPVKSALIVFS